MFLEDIKYLVRKFRGPYFLGNDEKICDIIMAPWFERMTVLVHYRGFVVPEGEDFENWHEWYNSVIYLD
jgi:glutathione S-transferase